MATARKKNKVLSQLTATPVRSMNPSIDLLEGLSKYQLKFINDTSTQKAAITSRRAGKSHACIRYLLKIALSKDYANCGYFGKTTSGVKKTFFRFLKKEAKGLGLKYKVNNKELILTFPNNSVISCTGADHAEVVDRFRGDSFDLIVLDECSFFGPHFEDLIKEVLRPTLFTTSGSLVMISTPSGICSGMFFDITTGKSDGWSVHRWHIRDNPAVKDPDELLEKELKQNGWDLTSPGYLREWEAQWVPYTKELVYNYSPTLNNWDGILPPEPIYVAGIDFGFSPDPTAISVVAYSKYSPNLFIVYSESWLELDTTDIINKAKEVAQKYHIVKWVADNGYGGKFFEAELARRHQFPIEIIDKNEKRVFIELFNADLRKGFIKCRPDTELTHEWNTLTKTKEGKENPKLHNDKADACLYAFRFSQQFLFRPQVPKLTVEQKEELYIQRLSTKLQNAESSERRKMNSLFGVKPY